MKRLLGLSILMCVSRAFAAPVSVHVTDAQGKPVAAARVWFEAPNGDSVQTGVTDARGEARADVPAEADSVYRGRAVALAPGLAVGGAALNVAMAEIKLGAPVTLTGVVNDEQGKPVADAAINLMYVMKVAGTPGITVAPGEGAQWEPFTARSGADGRWKFDFLPAGERVSYQLSDARFTRLRGDATLPAKGSLEAKPLVARPGADLTGRVVDETGKPLDGIRLTASNDNMGPWDTVVSAADGTYRMTRLGTGTYKVQVSADKKTGKVAAPRNGVQAAAGETRSVPDIVMTPGATLVGTITDAKTGLPIKGVHMSASDNWTLSGADGKYRVQVPPGVGRIYVAGKPNEYLYPKNGSPRQVMALTLNEGETRTIDFKLEPAQPLAGRAVTEDGKPAAGVRLAIGQAWREQCALVAADGTFSILGLDPGEISLSAEGEWTVVKPLKLTVPSAAPVEITLRRTPLTAVTGRVLDDAGTPIENAEVTVSEYIEMGSGGGTSRPTAIRSDRTGTWKWTPSQANAELSIRVAKEGYRFLSGGKLTRRKEILSVTGTMIPNTQVEWTATDAVLQKLSAALAGRVVDEKGAPVPGATVWAPGSESIVTADAAGSWKLSGLPPGVTDVMGAAGALFALAKVPAAGPGEAPPTVDLVLRAVASGPPDMAAARAEAALLFKGGQNSEMIPLLQTMAMTDPDGALKLAAGLKPGARDAAVAQLLLAFARYDDKRAQERIPDLLGALPSPLAGYESLMLAAHIAPYEPDEAKAVYDRERAKLAPLNINDSQSVFSHLFLAAIAARLQLPEANELADKPMAALIQKYGENDKMHMLEACIDALGRGGADFVARAIAQFPEARRPAAYARAIESVVNFDVNGARRLLDAMPTPAEGGNTSADRNAFDRAATLVITTLGKMDPAAALVLARRVKGDFYEGLALAKAAVWQPKAEAVKLLREAAATPERTYSRLPIARIASTVDAALGEQMALEIEKDLQASPPLGEQDTTTPELAWILGRTQPGYARLLLERLWDRTKTQDWWTRHHIALAMQGADWERAHAMARSMSTPGDEGQRARGEQRLTLMMAQWSVAPREMKSVVSIAKMNRQIVAFDGIDWE